MTTKKPSSTVKSVTWSESAPPSSTECMENGRNRVTCEDGRGSCDENEEEEEQQDERRWAQRDLDLGDDGGYNHYCSQRRTNDSTSHSPGGQSTRFRSMSQKFPRSSRRRPPCPNVRRRTKIQASVSRHYHHHRSDDDDESRFNDSDSEEDECYDESTRLLHQRVAEEMEHALFGGDGGGDDDVCGDEEVDDENCGRNTAVVSTGATPKRRVELRSATLHLPAVTRDFTLFGDDGGTNEGTVESSSTIDRRFGTSMRNRRAHNSGTAPRVSNHALGRTATGAIMSTKQSDGLIYSQTTYLEFLEVAERMMKAPTRRQVLNVQYIAIVLFLVVLFRVMSQVVASTIGSSILVLIAAVWACREVWDTVSGNSHPLKWVRWVHSSPVQHFTIVGTAIGLLRSVWSNIVQPTIIDTLLDVLFVIYSATFMTEFQAGTMWRFNVAHFLQQSCRRHQFYQYVDRGERKYILCLGATQGLLWGLLIGLGWRLLFGNVDRPTSISKCLHRHVWKRLKRQYRLTSAREPSVLSGRTAVTKESTAGSPEEAAVLPTSPTSDLPTKCAICLEPFIDATGDNDNMNRLVGQPPSLPPPMKKAESFMLYDTNQADRVNSNIFEKSTASTNRYQLHPCCHYFHRDCACEWLTINKSCPVCRVPVQAILGCT